MMRTAKEFTFYWRLHIPTGERERLALKLTRVEALDMMNNYNRLSGSVMGAQWLYWLDAE